MCLANSRRIISHLLLIHERKSRELEGLCLAFQQVQTEEVRSVFGFVTGKQSSHLQILHRVVRKSVLGHLNCHRESVIICGKPFPRTRKVMCVWGINLIIAKETGGR